MVKNRVPPKMGWSGKWQHGPKPGVQFRWFNFDPHPFGSGSLRFHHFWLKQRILRIGPQVELFAAGGGVNSNQDLHGLFLVGRKILVTKDCLRRPTLLNLNLLVDVIYSDFVLWPLHARTE